MQAEIASISRSEKRYLIMFLSTTKLEIAPVFNTSLNKLSVILQINKKDITIN